MDIYYDRETIEVTWQVGDEAETETYRYGVTPAQYTESHEARIGSTNWRTLDADVTVPANVMLLLPVSAEDTGCDQETGFNPDGTKYSKATGKDPQAELFFHKLTIPAGKTLTVNGTVLVNAVTGRPNAGHYDMDVTGGYGEIALEGDIVVKSGGLLDVCGYVTGSGTVTAEAGGDGPGPLHRPQWARRLEGL